IGTPIEAPEPTGCVGSVSWPQSLIWVPLVSHQMRNAMLDEPPVFEMFLNGTPSQPLMPLSKVGPGFGRKLQLRASPSPRHPAATGPIGVVPEPDVTATSLSNTTPARPSLPYGRKVRLFSHDEPFDGRDDRAKSAGIAAAGVPHRMLRPLPEPMPSPLLNSS